MSATKTINLQCIKCSGTGQLPNFKHIKDGVCFLCGGTGHYGKMSAGEARKNMNAADRANFDRKNAPYYVTSEYLGDENRVSFWDLKKAAEYALGCRNHTKIHGKVSLCHLDGTFVTRGEVRAA